MAAVNFQYAPAPAPATGSAELERYLADETQRIQQALPVPVYGGLYMSGFRFCTNWNVTPAVLGTAKGHTWTGAMPTQPEGVETDIALGTVSVKVPGTYAVQFLVSTNILPANVYNRYIDLYANGVATLLRAFEFGGATNPPSVSFVGMGMIDVTGPTAFDLRYSRAANANPDSQLWVAFSSLTVSRAGA